MVHTDHEKYCRIEKTLLFLISIPPSRKWGVKMRIQSSIRFKFLCGFLSISLIPLFMIIAVTIYSNSGFYSDMFSQASYQELEQLVDEVDGNLEQVDDIAMALIMSQMDSESIVLSICEQEGEGEISQSSRLKNYRNFKYICSNLIGVDRYVEGVYLFCDNGYNYSYQKSKEFYLERDIREQNWFRQIKDGSEIYVTDFYEPLKIAGCEEPVLISARKFTDLHGKHQGIIVLVCNMDIFRTVSGSKLPWSNNFIIDDKGEVLYGDIESAALLTENDLREIRDKGSGVITKGKANEAYIYGKLHENDWNIISTVSFDSLYQLYRSNLFYIFAAAFFILAFIIGIMLYIKRSLIKPLTDLAQTMDHAAEEEFCFQNNYSDRKDEIGMLYAYYGKMLKQINELIGEKYEYQIRLLQTKLHNLMSQINAHFIFNTLENISCLAEFEENRQIAKMSKSLGDMLRYSINCESEYVVLSREIKHVEDYIKIQEIRFANHIELETDIPEEMLKRKVMKFMLQPIVENAIEHGLSGREAPWVISIYGRQEENMLLIEVADNGCGMDEQELCRVRDGIANPREEDELSHVYNIGLFNINRRVQLLSSGEFGLKIDSEAEVGTIVTIKLPLL